MKHKSLCTPHVFQGSLTVLAFSVLSMSLALNETAFGAVPDERAAGPITQEVTFTNGQDVLAGTLHWPRKGRPFPAVVLLTGGNRGPRGPLLIRIARRFAEKGIAVLHYDSPGTGRSTGNTILQSRDDRAREAVSAVRFLRKQRAINSKQIGLWGGSEGACVALLTAATYNQEVSFVVAVSGGVQAGGTVFEQMCYSAEKFAYSHDLTLDEMQKIVTFEQLTIAFLTGLDIVEWNLIETRTSRWPDESWAEYIKITQMHTHSVELTTEEKQKIVNSFRNVMRTFVNAKWSRLAPFEKKLIKQIANLDTDQFFAFLKTPRFAQDWDWDLRRKPEKVRRPVLAIFGRDDDILPPNLCATRLEQYLSDAKNADFEMRIIPGASHILTKSGSGVEGEFAPGYLDMMTSWIHAHTTGKVKNQRSSQYQGLGHM